MNNLIDKIKKYAEVQGEEYLVKKVVAITTDVGAMAPVQTGKLRDSIHYEQLNKLHYQIGSDLPYAVYVEYGTRNMAPQPFLLPAVRRNIKS
jgi:HK97 gp10 family phage protein